MTTPITLGPDTATTRSTESTLSIGVGIPLFTSLGSNLSQTKTSIATSLPLRRIGETKISTLSFGLVPLSETGAIDPTIIPDLPFTKNIPSSSLSLQKSLDPSVIRTSCSFMETGNIPFTTGKTILFTQTTSPKLREWTTKRTSKPIPSSVRGKRSKNKNESTVTTFLTSQTMSKREVKKGLPRSIKTVPSLIGSTMTILLTYVVSVTIT